MKLRQRTLLMISVALLGLVGVFYTSSSTILLSSFAKLEAEDTQRNVERASDAFSEEIAKLNFTVHDWAEWNDTYEFIQDGNSTYRTTNLNTATIARLKINLMLYAQPSGKPIFGKSFDSQTQQLKEIPPSIQAYLANHPSLLQPPSSTNQLAGVVLLPEGPMLVASSLILTGEGKGPAQGTLLMGRYLDSTTVERLASITHLALSVYRIDDPQLPLDFVAAKTHLTRQFQPRSQIASPAPPIISRTASESDRIFVHPLNREAIAGYTLINDLNGKPAVLLRVELPRRIYQQGQASQRYLFLTLLVIGLGFGSGTLLLLERLVLRRLAHLIREVSKITTCGDFSLRVAALGSDELSSLGAAINQMLEALGKSQRQLRHSQESYRSVVDHVKEVIFQIDGAGLWQFLNPAWDKITGFALEESLGKPFLSYIHPEDRPHHRQQFQRLMTQEATDYRAEVRLVSKDSKLCWMELESQLTLDAKGRVLGVSGTLYDITKRKQAATAVQLLQNVTQAISEAEDFATALKVALTKVCEATDWDYGEAWVLTPERAGLELSPAWYSNSAVMEDFRYLSEAFTFPLGTGLPGRVWLSKEPEWIQDVSQEAHHHFMRVHIALEVGLRAGFGVPITADSEVLAILVFFMFEAREEDRSLVELVSAVATQLGSVMQRKRAEEALRLAEEKYRSIFENSLEGIFQTAPNGSYLSANPALAKIYGYSSPEDLIANLTNAEQLYIEPDRRSEFILALEAEGVVSRFESEVIRRDGNQIWISETARAVHDAKGQLLYYEGTVADITDRKRFESALRLQQAKSEELLLNILPQAIAEKLKQSPGAIADSFPSVTVLFADIVNFTQLAARMSPTELVNLLNQIFSAFDRLAERHGLEKIKTIGDAYMAVGGVPLPRQDHAEAMAEMALDMQTAIAQLNLEQEEIFPIRIGINTGPVVAGVIGIKKFIYDLWGDTVNIASRMESEGIAGCIQVTASTYQCLKDKYLFIERGEIPIKGRGAMKTYLLMGRKAVSEIEAA
uniref:adenylate/guanylate cyclase domain-containing protein n=1 Tax=Trichocoleus desertorum TaxID=1481672 RepID=UPI0025B45550|nr:adenylate/guanylate cyclase domain-containing protein [Trichocoleus desertorum]